jgi:hypothetical protein
MTPVLSSQSLTALVRDSSGDPCDQLVLATPLAFSIIGQEGTAATPFIFLLPPPDLGTGPLFFFQLLIYSAA